MEMLEQAYKQACQLEHQKLLVSECLFKLFVVSRLLNRKEELPKFVLLLEDRYQTDGSSCKKIARRNCFLICQCYIQLKSDGNVLKWSTEYLRRYNFQDEEEGEEYVNLQFLSDLLYSSEYYHIAI